MLTPKWTAKLPCGEFDQAESEVSFLVIRKVRFGRSSIDILRLVLELWKARSEIRQPVHRKFNKLLHCAGDFSQRPLIFHMVHDTCTPDLVSAQPVSFKSRIFGANVMNLNRTQNRDFGGTHLQDLTSFVPLSFATCINIPYSTCNRFWNFEVP